MTKTADAPAAQNGTGPDPLAEALSHEEDIRREADAIWNQDERGGLDEIDAYLFSQLRPLLRKPIPAGFIEHVGEVSGKPYESTGVRSSDVQMARLDNVLGPMNWGYEATHTEDGKRCRVVAWVGPKDKPLFARDSWGGMNRGSTEGNLWKGSFTNAAKLAFARLGPGWEVYVGAADFDPDTDEDAAKVQEAAPSESPNRKLPADKVQALETAIAAAGLTDHLPMKLRSFGVESLKDLTVDQGITVYEWCQAEVASG